MRAAAAASAAVGVTPSAKVLMVCTRIVVVPLVVANIHPRPTFRTTSNPRNPLLRRPPGSAKDVEALVLQASRDAVV